MTPNYNLQITIVRGSGLDEQRLPMRAMDLTSLYALPVDADVQEGDRIEQELPNGRSRTVHVTKVDVLQSPFPGGASLDHTEAHYGTAPPTQAAVAGGTTWNAATNMQVATGPHAHQTMNVGATAEYLQDLIKGIAELVTVSGASQGVDVELERARDEAVAELSAGRPGSGAAQRFAEWVSDKISVISVGR